MERKIGEVFELDGVKLRVDGESLNECCGKCYFDIGYCIAYKQTRGHCSSSYRLDNQNVIFTEVKE